MIGDEHVEVQDGQKNDKIPGFSIDINDSGVFVKIHSIEDGASSVNEIAIFEQLNKQGVTEYNRSLIIAAIKAADEQPVKVAEKPKVEPQPDPEIQVNLTRDKMEAALEIVLPPRCTPLTMESVLEKIKASGIVFGIDDKAIQQAYESPGTRVTFACGQPPMHGTNAQIKHHFILAAKSRPQEMEDGSVDFKNLNLFTTVQQGDLLAEKIPATPGIAGMDVLGNNVIAKPGKDMLLPIGKNVSVVDTNTIVADIAGQILMINNKINVMPIIEIKEDVDVSTGNIEFIGNVTIRGSVQPGFSVKAEGNVEIFGTVSGGIVEGKNVVIKMGIQGMHRGYVKAKENVVAKFIENATVHAGVDILVSDVILHSRITAGKKILVEGRRGLITGGTIMAGEEIRAKVIGTQMSTSTELEVGVNPSLREEYQHIRREMKKVEINLEQAQKALSILRSMDQHTIPPEKREMLLKLTKAQFHLVGQVETMRTRMAVIEGEFEEMRTGRIKVAEIMYPGVKVVIGTLVKPIRDILKFSSLYAEDGEIKIGTFK
ncbi:DUF342 domain-containing protein [Pelosinus fermentans]|uniref:Flagellar Assembly Protein A N-terminal region domain-containing protein n=1 Tax=Pelosinus fermentans JBW45 TaxID=1192197 RepID=I9DLJ4_9FIRM|nr:FapA family protein [Pelosinus fermentans]AJQ27345.1 protein of unknown function DUF342 [Pelosinus fermentans JBW45]